MRAALPHLSPHQAPMPEPQRRTQDKRPPQQRPAFFDGLVLGLGIALLAVLGSQLRAQGGMPPLWPVAPVLMGVMLRFPHLSHSWSWGGCVIGMVSAQYLSGVAIFPALWIALATTFSSLLGYLTITHLSPQSRTLRNPAAVMHMLLACLVASVADGMFYALLGGTLSLGLAPRNMLHWFASSLVNYVAILPMVLTLPQKALSPRYWEESTSKQHLEVRMLLPLLALALCTATAWTLQGKAAPVFTLPAMLWCAMAFPLFASCVLTAILGMLFFLGMALGWLHAPVSSAHTSQWLADYLTLSALLPAPLMVASAMAAQREVTQRLRVMAEFDPLTRLPVRSAFFQWGNKLLQHRYVQRQPVSVLLLDLDQLQIINDNYGHSAGDKVLAALGRHLHNCLRRQDCVGRLGGEEFAIILCNQTVQDTQQVIERICVQFAQQPIVLEHGETVRCTITAGGVIAERAPLSLPSLLSQADQALRAAKRHGAGQWELRPYRAIEADATPSTAKKPRSNRTAKAPKVIAS